MSAFEALPIRLGNPDDATAEHDFFSFFLSEQRLAREAVYDGDARLLAALGAGDLVSASLDHLDTVAHIGESSTNS